MTNTGYLPPLVGVKERPFPEIMTHLHSLGYFGDRDRDQVKRLKRRDGEAQDAIAHYQDFHGLVPDGEAGPVTQKHLTLPRCGLPDFQASHGCLRKWGFKDVTYSHRLSFRSLSSQEVSQAFQKACNQWNAVCGLNLTHIDSLQSANIWARSAVIDGSGSTLAWSYLPQCGSDDGTRLEQRYDTRESWTFDMLVAVICHEVGHAIGLDHSGGSNLMAPTYNPRVTRPQSGDIDEVIRRYGKPQPKPEPEPPIGGDVASAQVIVNGELYLGNLIKSR